MTCTNWVSSFGLSVVIGLYVQISSTMYPGVRSANTSNSIFITDMFLSSGCLKTESSAFYVIRTLKVTCISVSFLSLTFHEQSFKTIPVLLSSKSTLLPLVVYKIFSNEFQLVPVTSSKLFFPLKHYYILGAFIHCPWEAKQEKVLWKMIWHFLYKE